MVLTSRINSMTNIRNSLPDPVQEILPSQGVNCLTTDKDGNIWVGTDKGVTTFYCPGDVFSEYPCDAQQIVISSDDGYNGYLLGTGECETDCN
jgi:ligand-binding sensor domain-containing protein